MGEIISAPVVSSRPLANFFAQPGARCLLCAGDARGRTFDDGHGLIIDNDHHVARDHHHNDHVAGEHNHNDDSHLDDDNDVARDDARQGQAAVA
jgi:hypothetical protein